MDSTVVTRMRMRCYGHMAHGTSQLYTLVRSVHNLHSLGPSALGCVNSVETCTSVINLYIYSVHVPLSWLVAEVQMRYHCWPFLRRPSGHHEHD